MNFRWLNFKIPGRIKYLFEVISVFAGLVFSLNPQLAARIAFSVWMIVMFW